MAGCPVTHPGPALGPPDPAGGDPPAGTHQERDPFPFSTRAPPSRSGQIHEQGRSPLTKAPGWCGQSRVTTHLLPQRNRSKGEARPQTEPVSACGRLRWLADSTAEVTEQATKAGRLTSSLIAIASGVCVLVQAGLLRGGAWTNN